MSNNISIINCYHYFCYYRVTVHHLISIIIVITLVDRNKYTCKSLPTWDELKVLSVLRIKEIHAPKGLIIGCHFERNHFQSSKAGGHLQNLVRKHTQGTVIQETKWISTSHSHQLLVYTRTCTYHRLETLLCYSGELVHVITFRYIQLLLNWLSSEPSRAKMFSVPIFYFSAFPWANIMMMHSPWSTVLTSGTLQCKLVMTHALINNSNTVGQVLIVIFFWLRIASFSIPRNQKNHKKK